MKIQILRSLWKTLRVALIGVLAFGCVRPDVKTQAPSVAVKTQVPSVGANAPRFSELNNSTVEIIDDQIVKVAAKPESGFNFPYYLFIPGTLSGAKETFLYVQPNNSGVTTDDYSVQDKDARRQAEKSHSNRLARRLNVPLLVPVFPRPQKDWRTYTHYLNRNTMLVKDGPLKRIDLQLIAMIDDARGILSRSGINVFEKVFMHGFSASSGFTLRFTALHPDRVKAAAAGGVNALPIFPVKDWKGHELRYPLGIADLKQISGSEFNLNEYLKVPQFIYMGYWDVNDTTPFEDSWDKQDAALIYRLFGKKMMPDRWTIAQEIFASVGSPAQLVTYNSTRHTIKPEMEEDLASFFSSNKGESIIKILPHQYPFEELKEIKVLHINKIIWQNDNTLPEFARGSQTGRLLVSVEEWNDQQNYSQMAEFVRTAGLHFFLKAKGAAPIEITRNYFTGSVSSDDGKFQAYVISLNLDQFEKMKFGVDYHLETRNENSEFYWVVRPHVVLRK